MPPFLNYEWSPTATDTGLIVPGDASGTTSGSSTFGNGLSTNQNFNQPILNTVSDPLLTHGGVPKPPLVDVHGEATRLLGQENIGGYLRDFYKKPQNEVFQDLVNGAVSKTGKTFETAGMKELMLEMMKKYEHRLAQAVNDMTRNPYDLKRETNLYRLFMEMGAELNQPVQSDVPVQANAVPVLPVQSDDAPTKPWWNIWGGRKTARNHSRSHKRNHKRSRSRKQYKKLKRSSRSRRR